ncbi:caspase family protein [Asanoa sp. NPDC049573]|uniref:caspase, EACC1-associated type n=1 Tax=Asanoa sp. NPDC049573 TaxID=3155396 RepID=UPI00344967FF
MDGRRLALVVATSDYQDAGLRRLRAPAQDAAELVEVLGDQAIGGFTVTPVLDGTERDVRIAVERFLTACGPDDFALVYLSCHGLLDARGQLWFAAGDTLKNLLGSTAIGAAWLRERLENCRATRQLVLLDCCFSGAFVKGGKGAAEVGVETLHGGGRGHVVLTASRATEYSYEGEPVDGGALAGSVFTTALVHGLRTGEADLDNDGVITTDEAYDYVNGYLRAVGANQTPTHTVVGGVGKIELARSPVGIRPVVVPAQPTVRVVAEAAEIMALTPAPAPVGASGQAPPTDGPAAELATLRAIRRAFDDQAVLERALRERPVGDVVTVVAAVRASGLADRAGDVLRIAATVRPIDEIIALVEAARGGPHPADADVLLAAVGTSRQVTDVVRLCADPAQPEDDVATVLGWAARTRPVTEVRPLARLLPTERGQLVLHEFGKVRSGTEVAELFTGASKAAVSAVLTGVRARPAAQVAVVVTALRNAGDDTTADRVLGWVDGLPVGEVVDLVEGLRAAGAADDAETVLHWAGWRLPPPLVAALVAALDAAGRTDSVGAVLRSAESRTLDDIHDILHAAVSAHADHIGPMLEMAARRSPADLATLLRRLDLMPPAVGDGAVARANELRRHLVVTGPARSTAVLARLATMAVASPVETVSRLVRALVDAGHAAAAERMVGEAAHRPSHELIDLVTALATDPSPALVDVLVTRAARYPHATLPAVLAGLHRANAPAIVERFLQAVPAVRWEQVPAAAPETPEFAKQLIALTTRGDAARRSRARRATMRRALARAAITAVCVVILFVTASLTRVFGHSGFGAGNWAAWAATTVVTLLLLRTAATVAVRRSKSAGHDTVVRVATIGAAVAGLALGWFVPPLTDAATHVRDWLAWKF